MKKCNACDIEKEEHQFLSDALEIDETCPTCYYCRVLKPSLDNPEVHGKPRTHMFTDDE